MSGRFNVPSTGNADEPGIGGRPGSAFPQKHSSASVNDRLKSSLPPPRSVYVDKTDKDKTELSFEDAMNRLENIVESMEAGDVPLAELLTRYEEGSKLLKTCEARLKDAELKIEQLKKQRSGTPLLEEFPFERGA